MKIKMVSILVIMLLILTVLPLRVLAGDENNPEVEDRILDVKLFGIFPFPLQNNLKYADIVSAWFHGNIENPDYLYVTLKIRELQEKTDGLEAIYDVEWTFNNNSYITCVHANPKGFGGFAIGKSIDGDHDFESWENCEGNFNVANNTITWIVPKETIGYPHTGNILTDISPHTHLRFTDNSGLPLWDLFKDLPWNAKSIKDYTIQY
ncbi:MAG: hypothetical protein NTZ75_07505 [Euryarchaeota archaeon]|nr:hypothetical protein [Euryarchaeota archaeon]